MQQSRDNHNQSWQQFEEETFKIWFPPYLFECLHITPSFYHTQIRYIASASKPDFQFSIKGSNRFFWVECKQRTLYDENNVLLFFKPGQRERYKKEGDVFIFLRLIVNGYEKYFLIPIYAIKSDFVTTQELVKFRIAWGFPIRPLLINKYYPLKNKRLQVPQPNHTRPSDTSWKRDKDSAGK